MIKLLLFIVLTSSFWFSSLLKAQELDTTMWSPNGHVNTIIRNENTIYLGGMFDYVGPKTATGVIVNTSDGKLTSKSLQITKDYYQSNGAVLTSVADGKGGLFIGGTFSIIQGNTKINYLAHILANGSLDTSWNPNSDDYVTHLAIHEDLLFVGGGFSYIGNQSKRFLAAIDVNTGNARPWNCTINYFVHGITIAQGLVYINGEFTYVNGQERKGLAAVNSVTGELTDWNPVMDGKVNSLAIWGDSVFICGQFTKIAGLDRKYLAAIDATTGLPLSWYPELDGSVGKISISNSIIYIGGSFTKINQNNRNHLASFDASTGELSSWDPNPDGNYISVVSVYDGYIYVAGSFKQIDGINRNYVASFNENDGKITQWNPCTNNVVQTISLSQSGIFIGGNFTSVNGVNRNNLAAIDATTGEATMWNPNPLPISFYSSSIIYTLEAVGNIIYVGGSYSSIGGKARNNLAAVDGTTGLATSWDPNPDGPISVSEVYGSLIYVSGDFTYIGGKQKRAFAAVNILSGQASSWSPPVGLVNSIAITEMAVYVGGGFSYMVDGKHKRLIAALDPITGQAFDWGPSIPFSNTGDVVNDLAVNGNTLYFGGSFTFTHNGQVKENIAAIDIPSGQVTAWQANAGYQVYSLASYGNLVYLSSSSFIDGIWGRRFGALDVTTGKLTNSVTDIYGDVKTINFWKDVIYVGGTFSILENSKVQNFAAFGRRTLTTPNYIKGKIIDSEEGGCNNGINGKGIPNIIVAIEPGPHFGITDNLGNYSFAVDTGTYIIRQILPEDKNKLMEQVCPTDNTTHIIKFNSYNNTAIGKDFINKVTSRFYLSTSVASDRRRRCFTGNTIISYCNEGNLSANDVKVQLQLPEHVVLVNTSAAYTIDKDKNYVFQIGALQAGSCGTIQIKDSVLCHASNIRGLTQCTKVWITPANTTTPSVDWDLSDINLKASCLENGRVKVGIYNTGKAHMSDSSSYRIFLDARVVFSSRYKLNQGDSLILQVPANGQTLRLEADQRPGHPSKQQTNITIEACGTNSEGKVSLGYVAQLPQDDAEPEVAIECLPITDSFDPNDKLVSPAGVTEHHYTPTDRALEYAIRFQNTGTDSAYRVVVIDTLSEHLDISTLKMHVASHPYKLSVTGKGKPILTFTFDNIMLPDSNRNEPQSHGYIKFSIKPKSDLTEKTRIENFADIFFDYNEPVRTNTTLNSIYDQPLPTTNDARIAFCNVVEQPSISLIYREDLVCNVKADRYEWFLNGKPLFATTQTIKATEAGIYTVRIEKHACQSSLSEGFAYTLPEPLISNFFEIYPNPNSGTFTFYMQAPAGKIVEAILWDALGRVVWSKSFIAPSNNTIREEVILPLLKPGMYIIKTTVDTPRGGVVKKILIR